MSQAEPVDPLVALLNDSVWPFLLIDDRALRADLVKNGAILKSVAAGGRAAAQLRREFPREMPEEILQALHVQVIRSQENPNWGTRMQCAEYQHRPPKVVIYEQAVASLVETAQRYRITGFASLETMRNISLAHELYHHLECTRHVRLSSQFRRISFQIGPLKRYHCIQELDEIAAHAFAQALLALAVNPAVLGLLRRYGPDQSREIWTEAVKWVHAGRTVVQPGSFETPWEDSKHETL